MPALGEPAIRLSVTSDLAEAEPIWKALESGGDLTPFQTFGRLSKWQAHIGAAKGARPVIVIGRDQAGRAVLLLPLALERFGPLRRLTWLGTELSDYNAPLLAPDFASLCPGDSFRRVWRAALLLLRADPRIRFDFVDMSKMPAQVGAQPNPFLALPVAANPNSAYRARLGTDWNEFYATKRSSATRRRERRQLKHIAEHGEISFRRVSAPDAAGVLDVLFSQKGRALARRGAPNIFARPGYRDFYLDLAASPDTRDSIHLSALTVGETSAAAGVGLLFRSCFYLVLSSYDDGPISRLGPGRAHLYALMQDAIESGASVFDFTIGDEPYKLDWSDIILELGDHTSAASAAGAMVVAGLRARRMAERIAKQNPRLRHAFSRMRAWFGRRGAPPAEP